MEFLDIPYHPSPTRDPFREFDLYLPPSSHFQASNTKPPLLCFAHGGAWRTEDKTDHRDLARKLAISTHFPVAMLNYRLTPRDPPGDDHFKHPGHSLDLLQCLIFFTSWEGPPGIGPIYDPENLYLAGHSCSAHMLTSIFLDSSSITPGLAPPISLLQAVKGIIISEGIYDLELLLSDFPNYAEWFINPAFGKKAVYASFSATNFPLRNPEIRWLIVHSKGDTLVNLPQSQVMYNHLCKLNGTGANVRVQSNMDQLDGEHDDILQDDQYVRIVTNFVLHE